MTEDQRLVLKTIAYFDVFHFPLTMEEIWLFCSLQKSRTNIEHTLNELIEQQLLKSCGKYILPFFSDVTSIQIRETNEQRAAKETKKVKRYAKLIASFPFVEAVAISGSYSKGVLGEEGDIDYFIITRPGRLWLCRTLLIAYKKVILLNSRKFFCVNYFIDSNHLEIPDKNLFAATELKTLLPVYNLPLFERFLQCNSWADDVIPRFQQSNRDFVTNTRKNILSRSFEKWFSSSIGEWLDEYFFRFTLKHWRKKFHWLNESDFDLNMRTRKTVSKHHPQGFQVKVLKALDERMEKFHNR